ncbi:hypothetical protein Trydic_g22270 [Trypoxylus dichotomus]
MHARANMYIGTSIEQCSSRLGPVLRVDPTRSCIRSEIPYDAEAMEHGLGVRSFPGEIVKSSLPEPRAYRSGCHGYVSQISSRNVRSFGALQCCAIVADSDVLKVPGPDLTCRF